MNRLLSAFVLFALPFISFGQQLPLFTQYRSSQSLINAASIQGDYFTYDQNVGFGGSFRSQWTGLEGAPRTQSLHGEYFNANRGGVSLLTGGYLINDQTGPTGFTGLYGRLGGVLSEDPRFSGLSFGLNLGVVQFRVDGSALRLRDQNDVTANEAVNKIFPDVGLGVFGYTTIQGGFFDDDVVFGGISIPQVLGLDLEFEGANGTFYTKRIQHYYAHGGIYHFFRDRSFIEATTWVKYTPNVPVNVDLNLRYQMQQNFWGGVGVSSAGAIHVEAGFILGDNVGFGNTVRIGYSFGQSLSTFGPFVGSVHEINMSYAFER